jgi:anti-sigma B factor antagonist
MLSIPQFNLSTDGHAGRTVLHVSGELDISTAPEFKRRLAELIDGSAGVITIDMADLEFIDSNGIHALVTSFKLAQEHGGTIELRSLQPSTYKVLEIVGLTEVIPIV